MVNIVKTNANSEIGFPTLERYKEIYPSSLSSYLKEYKDNTEKRFIELQIEHYKTYCDEFINDPKNTFNKYAMERFYTSRLLVIEYLESKLKDNKYYKIKEGNFGNKNELTLYDFISNVNSKEVFADDLKKTFNIEKGKNIRIMIDLLNNELIVRITDGNLSSFHKALKKYFDRDIGSYESFRKAKEYDSISIEKIKEKLNSLIINHKVKQ